AVTASGETEGSVGGGIMEHKFVEMAKKMLQEEALQEPSVRKQIHNKNAGRHQSGMICSGEQTILLYRLKPEELVVVEQLTASLEQFRNGTLQLSPEGLQFAPEKPETDFYFSL